MEDNDIKKLFNAFDPELPSDFDFMSKLQHRLELMEMIKHEQLAMQRRNRMAVLIAAMAGFVMGVVLTLLYPLAAEWLRSIDFGQPSADLAAGLSAYNFIAWGLLATLSGVTALNAYEIALAKLSHKK